MAFRWLVLRRAPVSAHAMQRASSRAADVALGAAIAIVPAAIARLALQTVDMRFPGDPWLGVAWQMISATNWGTAWLLQVAAAVASMLVLIFARRGSRSAWSLAPVFAVALLVTPTLASHAMAAEGRQWWAVPADFAHCCGATLWLGTLAIMFATARIAETTEQGNDAYVASLLPIFSPLALTGAALVVCSGVVSSLTHIDQPLQLLASTYGKVLAAKLLAVFAIIVLGWMNWKKHTPGVTTSGASRIWRGMRSELIATVFVLILTAMLIVTPPPTDAMKMP